MIFFTAYPFLRRSRSTSPCFLLLLHRSGLNLTPPVCRRHGCSFPFCFARQASINRCRCVFTAVSETLAFSSTLSDFVSPHVVTPISSFHFVPSSCRHLRSGRLVVRPIACHRHYHRQTDLTSSSHCHHDRASVPSAAPSACFLRMVFPVSRVSTPLFISVCPARSRLQCSYAHARLRCPDQFCVRPT